MLSRLIDTVPMTATRSPRRNAATRPSRTRVWSCARRRQFLGAVRRPRVYTCAASGIDRASAQLTIGRYVTARCCIRFERHRLLSLTTVNQRRYASNISPVLVQHLLRDRTSDAERFRSTASGLDRQQINPTHHRRSGWHRARRATLTVRTAGCTWSPHWALWCRPQLLHDCERAHA